MLTCEQARTQAILIVAQVRNSADPAAKRDADRRAATVAEPVDRFDR
jgi:hypothetical protein